MTAPVNEDLLRHWLRTSDDAQERAVRTATRLRERVEFYEELRERLVAERDALRALLADPSVPEVIRKLAKAAERT